MNDCRWIRLLVTASVFWLEKINQVQQTPYSHVRYVLFKFDLILSNVYIQVMHIYTPFLLRKNDL